MEERSGEERDCVEFVVGLVRMLHDDDLGDSGYRGGRQGVADADWKGPATVTTNVAALRRRRRMGGLLHFPVRELWTSTVHK